MKFKFVVFLCIIFCQIAGAQETDTLKLFAKENPGSFWQFVTRFYPFSDDELIKYKHDILFIDENEKINWTKERIANHRLSTSLLRNKSIKWTEELVSIVINKVGFDFYQLYFDRPLTVSNRFLDSNSKFKSYIHEKHVIARTADSTTFYQKWGSHDLKGNRLIDFGDTYSGWPDDKTSNTLLPFESTPKYGQYLNLDINKVPIDIIRILKDSFSSYTLASCGFWDLSWEKFLNLVIVLDQGRFEENESVYNSLFKAKMSKQYLSEIYELLNKNESYYENRSSLIEDAIGYIPNISYPDSLLQYQFMDFVNNPKLSEKVNSYIIKPGMLLKMKDATQGPARFCDLYPSERLYIDGEHKICLVVSNKLHKIFQKFNTYNAKVIPIKLMYNSKWYGADTMDYYQYIFGDISAGQDILANGSIMIKPLDRDSLTVRDLIFSKKISEPNFIDKYIKSENKHEEFGYLEYKVMNLTQKFDLMYSGGHGLVFSKELVEAIEALKISGFSFSKNLEIQYKFKNNSKVNQKSRLDFLTKTIGTKDPLSNQKSIKKYYKILDQVKAYENSKDDVAKILDAKQNDPSDSISIKLHDFQVKNNVLLPEFYVRALKQPNFRTISTRGENVESWDALPIDRLHLAGEEWVIGIPQLFRAVVIGENGVGDYLVLLRKQSSAYEITSQVYALWHEMGEIEEVKIAKTK